MWKELGKKKENKLFDVDMLIIDEISMIDAVKFDIILEKINIIDKYRDKPLQIIICGDVLQLPPVDSISGYFFNAHHFDKFTKNAYKCRLTEVKRQDNKEFVEMLQRIRIGTYTDEDLIYIKKMKNNDVNKDDAVFLCAKNKDVDEINKEYYSLNLNEEHIFKKEITLSKKYIMDGLILAM